MKRELNKWQYGIKFQRCPPWRFGFYPYMRVWFLNFTSFPPEGEVASKEHYKGFLFEWYFKRTIVLTLKTFIVPEWLAVALNKVGVRPYRVYNIPIWIEFWK